MASAGKRRTALLLALALALVGCGSSECRLSGAYTEFGSFEGTTDGWEIGADDAWPWTWSIDPSEDRGVCGTQSLKFSMLGPPDQWPASIWIEKEFPLPAGDHPQLNLDVSLGTEDDQERMTDAGTRFLAAEFFVGARTQPDAGLAAIATSDTFKPDGSKPGFQWVTRPTQLDVPRSDSGKVLVRLGFNPNAHAVPDRTYYLDDLRLFFRAP